MAAAITPLADPAFSVVCDPLADPVGVVLERAKKLRKPKGHPQPVWFTPF